VNARDTVDEVTALVSSVKPLFAGKPPEIMAAALAELLAIFLAGHYKGGDVLIARVLASHIEYVRHLVPFCIAELKERG
jgi:hypothetical protein